MGKKQQQIRDTRFERARRLKTDTDEKKNDHLFRKCRHFVEGHDQNK